MSSTTVQVQSNANLFEKFTQNLQKTPDIIFNSKLQNAILKYLKESPDESSIKEITDEEVESYAELQLNILSSNQKLTVIKICKNAFEAVKSMHKAVFSRQDSQFLQNLDTNSKQITNNLNQLKIFASRTRDPVRSLMDAYIKNFNNYSAIKLKIEIEIEKKKNEQKAKKSKNSKKSDSAKMDLAKTDSPKTDSAKTSSKKTNNEEAIKNKIKTDDYTKILDDRVQTLQNLNALMKRVALVSNTIKDSFKRASDALEKIDIHEMNSNDDYILYFLNKTKIDSFESSATIFHSLLDFTKLTDYAPEKLSGGKLNTSRIDKIKGLVQSLKQNTLKKK